MVAVAMTLDRTALAPPEFRDYLKTLTRRKWTVILTTVIVTAAALVYSFLQTAKYTAKSEVVLQPQASDQILNPNTPNILNTFNPQLIVQTAIEEIKSTPVKNAVLAELGEAPSISASQVTGTDAVAIKATSAVPQEAAKLANAYANAYISFIRTTQVNDVLNAGKQIQDQVNSLQTQINQLNSQIASAPASQIDGLNTQRAALQSEQQLDNEKLQELQVSSAVLNGGADMIGTASVPSKPSSPRPVRNGILAGVLGLVLGIGFAYLFEMLDDSIKSKEDVERVVAGIPVVAAIPTVDNWKRRSLPKLVSADAPRSAAAEAYRSLRTSIQIMGMDRPMRSVQVTSAGAGEGKSATVANLGLALASAGQSVIIADCDLRKPRIHEFFGLRNDVGFTSLLSGEVPVSVALQAVPGTRGLSLLASGPLPSNPAELLAGRRAAEVLSALQTDAEVVVIDSPPLLPVTDGAVLSSRVDATILIATVGRTTRRALRRALETLDQVDAPLVGIVLNQVGGEGSYGYKYSYRRGAGGSRPPAEASA
jgi:succinoglycan biosynthesis transport protein ExoP